MDQYLRGPGRRRPQLLLNIRQMFAELETKSAWLPVDKEGVMVLKALREVMEEMISSKIIPCFHPQSFLRALPNTNPLFTASMAIDHEIAKNQQAGGGTLAQLAGYCHEEYPFVSLIPAQNSKLPLQTVRSMWAAELGKFSKAGGSSSKKRQASQADVGSSTVERTGSGGGVKKRGCR